MAETSIYIHIPFCIHRCGYCDFNTYAGFENLIPAYAHALCKEIEFIGAAMSPKLSVHTVFFGGGTPSLIPAGKLAMILERLDQVFDLQPRLEISLEANPGTLSLEYLSDLRRLGINRLSLGVQSANPQELQLLERQHSYSDVIHSVKWARQAGFDNLNLDLIFGLPYQELRSWQNNLNLVIGLNPEHFSLYALTLEHATPFGHWTQRGMLSEPDPDLAADMYEWASERLERYGYGQYEISNWSRNHPERSYTCKHNLQYWHNLPYLGLGAGAHGYICGKRTVNVSTPTAYLALFLSRDPSEEKFEFPSTPATKSVTQVEVEDQIGETMMMGLRLVQEGVSDAEFARRFGCSLQQKFGKQIDRLVKLGLVEWSGVDEKCLRLTRRGRLLGNQVFVEFI